MKILAQGRRSMSGYDVPMKLALTFFVVFIFLGLASSIALYHNQFDFDSGQAATYYRGNADQPDAQQFYVKKSYRQLLEVTHFHLFIMPVVYLAFVHLYFLSRRSLVEKSVMTVLTFTGVLLEISAPWLVRYAGPDWARLFWISGMAITVPTVWMGLVCLWELWGPTPEVSEEYTI